MIKPQVGSKSKWDDISSHKESWTLCAEFSVPSHPRVIQGRLGCFLREKRPNFVIFFSQRTTLPLEDLPSSEEFQHDVKPWSQKNFIFKGNLLNVMIIPSLIFLLIWDFLVAYLQIHSIIIINNSEGSTRILINNINFNDILANGMMLLHVHNGLPHWEKWV